MICYLDSSVVLRKVLRQSRQLEEWGQIRKGVSSRLLRLECLRTLDRMRLGGEITNEVAGEARSRLYQLLRRIGLLPLTLRVLDRAELPLPTPLGSLDSIHLVTALLWRDLHGAEFLFATHDAQLALAAKASGLTVVGM